MAERVFGREIKCMMYSFGDARHPCPESAALVEDIVHRQMSDVISHASDVANVRGAKSVSVEDILFLLCRDKSKLRRVVRHLQMKEMAKKAGSQTHSEEEGNGAYSSSSTPTNKKRKYSLSFLTALDQIGNHEEMDELQLERLQRQDTLTAVMDVDEYLNYSECRLINFHKNTTKFKEWLGIEQKPNQEVVEVCGYLAYEAVREIVELSLLVKKDMGNVSFNPGSSHQHNNLQDPNTPSEFGSTPTFFTTPVSQQPTSTPPPSPPAPSPQPVSTRGRKRKRKSDATSQPPTVVTENQDKSALQPAHIREALRRYQKKTGPLIPFSTHVSKTTFTQRTV